MQYKPIDIAEKFDLVNEQWQVAPYLPAWPVFLAIGLISPYATRTLSGN